MYKVTRRSRSVTWKRGSKALINQRNDVRSNNKSELIGSRERLRKKVYFHEAKGFTNEPTNERIVAEERGAREGERET